MISNEKYNGVQKGSGALLQDLRNSKVQRELQREGACGPYLQDLRMSVTRKAGRTDDAPPPGKSAAAPSQRKRDDLAEESSARPPARSEVLGLCGLCGEISLYGPKAGVLWHAENDPVAKPQGRFISSPYSFPETPPRSAPACTPSHPPSCRPVTGTAPRPARRLRTGWAPPPPPGSRCPPR